MSTPSTTSSPGYGYVESSDPSATRLLARARHGSRRALDELVARLLPALRRWAHGRLPRWARSAADTTDLIHDTLVGTFRRLDTFEARGRHALSAYLREAVRNRIRDEHRRVARRGVSRTLSGTLVDPRPSPLDRAMTRDLEARYRAALARLTPDERDLIVGHIELAYNHAQLGHMTGRTPHAARMALRRAIARLAIVMRAS